MADIDKQTKGNILRGKLKSQKELKKITDSQAYKNASNEDKTEMLNRATMKKGGKAKKNTKRMNRLEELGRVDSEKAFGIDFVWSEFLRLGAFCSNRCRLSVSIVCKEMQINPLCKQMSQDRVHSFLRVH